jgi:hypothetical protein
LLDELAHPKYTEALQEAKQNALEIIESPLPEVKLNTPISSSGQNI